MTTNTTSMTKEAFTSFYRKLSRDASLMKTLVDMQSGVSERKAYEIADALVRDVAAFEGTLECLREDTMAVVDSFLQEAEILQGEHRMLNLHRIHFGLMVNNDATLVEAVKEGASYGKLFEQYYEAAGKDPAITEDVLKAQIRQQLGNLAVSPEVMTAIAEKLQGTENLLLSSVSVGADGQRFKCILAMQLYENNKADGMTTAEAAALACSSAETQAIADAAGRGLITQDRAATLISLVALTIILFAVLCHLPFFLNLIAKVSTKAVATSLLKSRTDILLIGYLVAFVSDAVAKLAGRMSAKYHFTHADQHAELMAGLHRIADALKDKVDYLKGKASSAVKNKTTQPAADVQADLYEEDTDPAYAF